MASFGASVVLFVLAELRRPHQVVAQTQSRVVAHAWSCRLIIVKAAYDAEAGVWYVEDSDLPGVNAWAATVQELGEKLPAVVLNLLEEEGDSGPDDVRK
jgi:predicted RNase H-like HicB family nuclease